MIALNPTLNPATLRATPDPGHRDAGAASAPLSPDRLLDVLNWRYAVKQYDPARGIDAATWDALEQALVLAPSSGGLQPWKFLVVDDPALRARLREASYGQPQITDADRLVVFTARRTFTEADVDRHVSRVAAVRGVPVNSLAGLKGMLSGITARPEAERAEWAARQAYIALGGFLTAAAALGVDATPMEGFDAARYDELLGLEESGYRSVVVAAAGHRAESDKYASLAKVRFGREEVVEHVRA